MAHANRFLRARVHRNIPSRESDESSAVEVTVRDPSHPLFGRRFRVIRQSVHRGGGFAVSFEVEYLDGVSLLVPVAATEPQPPNENRTKLSVEALHDLISLVEQHEHDADRTERPLGNAAGGAAAPDYRRGRRSSCLLLRGKPRRSSGGGKP